MVSSTFSISLYSGSHPDFFLLIGRLSGHLGGGNTMPKFITDNAGAFLILACVVFAILLNIVAGKISDLLSSLVIAVAIVTLFATVFIYK